MKELEDNDEKKPRRRKELVIKRPLAHNESLLGDVLGWAVSAGTYQLKQS